MGQLFKFLVFPAFCLAASANNAIDPYIICAGSTPDANANWPRGYTPDQYSYNNINLCSGVYGLRSAGGNSRNLGCQCTDPAGPLRCGLLPSDRRLIARRVQSSSNAIFPSWCTTNCMCSDAERVHEYAVAGQRAHGVFNGTLPISASDSGSSSDELSDINDITTPLLPRANDASEIDPSDTVAVNNVCGAPSCNATTDCASVPECNRCLLSSTVIPGAPTLLFKGICGVTAFTGVSGGKVDPFSGFGKRDEDNPPCVCNSTYVSYGCCSSEDGLIYERPEAKLGELTPDLGLR